MNNEELIVTDRDFIRLRALTSEESLAEELGRATVVPHQRIAKNIVLMHSRVTYVDESSSQVREVELVFPEEANPADGKISVLAPVGAALLGLSEGQAIDWPFPDGRLRRLRVERTLAPADEAK